MPRNSTVSFATATATATPLAERMKKLAASSPARAAVRSCRNRRPAARRHVLNKPNFISIADDDDDNNEHETTGKMPTRPATKAVKSSSTDSLFDFIPKCKPSKRPRNVRGAAHKDDGMLNTMKFESYMEYLWSKLSEEKRSSYMYLDCLWFSMYTDVATKSKVLTWIKNKHIFSKNYVFVPIVLWSHWSLLILCNLQSEKPCMLLLDSLQTTDPKRLEPEIRKFILDIYMSEEKPVTKKIISDIPLLVPKVPQQTNGEQCGAFVLYFIKLFIQSAPMYFTEEEYPYFLNEHWFSVQDLEHFREGIP